jgi:hypothetical protein
MPFAKGQSGNREGGRRHRAYVPRREGLTKAYTRVLSAYVPGTTKTYGALIAEQVCAGAASGQIENIMTCLGNDTKKVIRKEIDKLVARECCTQAQAVAAINLLMMPVLL